ncbi:hypothetical protein [Pseudomonas sp. OIL-1]|uniref:hypothetical protein n=1 Tax=Pseudomonas sp. OIL-1 TaxID=2706126 RepID=UPI0013A7150B|nr:hypothetical protein [Pseudomonas sp. OIL-1]QIB52292.1 hypothetical protein G3M63_15300 [Pseudomonas sp. OIL-1]
MNAAIDVGLWGTLRAVEERVMLLCQMASLAEADQCSGEAERYRALAADAEARLKPLRKLVLDGDFFKLEQAVTNSKKMLVQAKSLFFLNDIILILQDILSSALLKRQELIEHAGLH